jgi:UDP-galactopyranose mutase
MQIGDIYSGYPYSIMICRIGDDSVDVIPITADKNKIDRLNNNCYSEFMLNNRKEYALLHLVETIENIHSTKLDSVGKDIYNQILNDYAFKMLGVKIVVK